MSKKKQQKRSIEESCEGILAVLKAGQRQLEYLAHEHLDFGQVLRLEERIRVGSSPERAEIQRMRLLLDARLDHVQQMRALSSLAPLTLTPMDEKRFKEVAKIATPSPPPPKPPAKEAPVVSEEKPTETHQEAKNTEEPLENLKEPPIRTPESVTAAESNTPATKAPSTPAPAKKENNDPPSPPEPSTESPDISAIDSDSEAPSSLDTAELESDETETKATRPDPIPLGGATSTSSNTSGLSIQIRPASATTPENTTSGDRLLKDPLQDLMRTAGLAHSEGELERAIEAYSDLLDQVDEHLPALLARGRCLLEMKDYSAALSDFRRAQRSAETHPAPLVAIGDLFMARKEYQKAIEFFDKAIDLKSDHPQARCRRGLAHYHCGRFRQAFLDLQRAYKLDPEIPNIRRLVQMAIRKLEDSE